MPVTTVFVNDQPLLFEIEERHIPAPPAGEGQAESVGTTIGRAGDLGSFIQQACLQLYDSVKEAAEAIKPSEVELVFGVTLGGEAGVPFVAKGTAEANVQITLTWTPSPRTTAEQEKTPDV